MRWIALTLLVLSCAAAGSALAAPSVPGQPDARAWFVENTGTGDVLASHDSDEQMPIASITKLMTVLVVLDHEKLSDVVKVDPRVTTVGQESIYLQAGELMTVRDLIKGALIQSANDAADALALSVAPSFPAFAVLMNAKARQLGLTHSHFVRPDGLDAPGEHSTARDVMSLALDAMKIPFIRQTVATRTATISGGRTLHTWNDVMSILPGVFGVKTGHTNDAGWCEVAAIHGQGGVTVYAVILGSPSEAQRDTDLEALLEHALDDYRVVDAISDARVYAHVGLPYGKLPLALVARSSLLTVARVGVPLQERVVAPATISLPVTAGQVIGNVQVWAGTKLVGQRPLVAARSVAQPGVAGRVGFYAKRTAHNLIRALQ
jgi:serine-type D-Ala-D-Ala carboxypeptidase (penicillin-binding protein 5/6)